MQIFVFLIVGIFLIVFQTTILPELPIRLGYPDLVFILIAFVAYRFSWLGGIFLSFMLGWMMDVVSGIYLGTYLLEYLLVFVCLRILTINSPVKESAYQVPLAGMSYFLAQLLLYCVLALLVEEDLPPWSWSRVGKETIILIAATIPCFLLFNSLYEYLHKRRISYVSHRKKAGNRYR